MGYVSWIGVGVLKTGAEKTEKLLIEETPFLLVVALLRGKGSDGENSKEGGKNKMKRMVAVAVIAVLACALFLVPNVSAELIKISVNVTPIKGDFESSFTYIVTITNQYPFNVTGPLNLTVGSDYNNKSIKLYAYDQIITIPPGRTNISKVIRFTYPALMQGDFKKWTTEGKPCNWTRAWNKACFKYEFGHRCNETDGSPILTPPKPKIRLLCPRSVAWCEDFISAVYVEDKMEGWGRFRIFVDNLTEPQFDDSPYFPPGGDKYPYKGRPFNESMVCNYYTIVFNYNNSCYFDINESCRGHVARIPPPEIKAYLDEEALSEERNNTIYLEGNTNLTFKAKIEDCVEANASLKLDVYKNNESYWNCTWNNRTIKVTPDVPFERECDIPFKKERNNFTLNLSYSRLNEINETFSKTYSLNIIPLSIKFGNATVDPKIGNWTDEFNYSVEVNASRALNINLSVYDPCREREPWIDLGYKFYTKEDVNRPRKLNWTNEEPFKKCCVGRSKFYFGYLGKETQVFFGPDLIKPPPEFNNGTPNPNVTIYCNWSKSSTPCNYSVNVSTEDEYKYKVSLLVKDPVSNEWIPKGKPKDVSRETKNPVTWCDITPFESLNIDNIIDNITQYIGNVNISNFTFKYNGDTHHKEFEGPLLVAAFKDPKIVPPEPELGEEFNYSINVSASRNLNVTLKYYNGTKWVNASKGKPIQPYTPPEGPPYDKWDLLEWQCIANETWEKVMMEVEVEGEKKPIKVY